MNSWKKIADGTPFKQDIKFINGGEIIQIRCPFVMISNYGPYEHHQKDEDKAAIQSRIEHVIAREFPGYMRCFDPNFKVRYRKSSTSMHIPLTLEELERELEREITQQATTSNSQRSPTRSYNSSLSAQAIANGLTTALNQEQPGILNLQSSGSNTNNNMSNIKDRLREKIRSNLDNLSQDSMQELQNRSTIFTSVNSDTSASAELYNSNENSYVNDSAGFMDVNIARLALDDEDLTTEYELCQSIIAEKQSANQKDFND